MTDSWEGGRRVSAWRWEAVTVHGGWRVGRVRWVYDGRAEAYDMEIGDWAHETPFDNEPQARATATALNGQPEQGDEPPPL